jgi:hypothetical protein
LVAVSIFDGIFEFRRRFDDVADSREVFVGVIVDVFELLFLFFYEFLVENLVLFGKFGDAFGTFQLEFVFGDLLVFAIVFRLDFGHFCVVIFEFLFSVFEL